MPKRKKTELRLLNKLTGEINTYEIDPQDPDALAAAEEEAKAFIEEIDKFRAQIKKMADDYMATNDYKPIEVLGGKYQWVHRAPVTKVYSFLTARSILDEDMLLAAGVVKVNSGALKKLSAELVERNEMPDGFWAAMDETATTKASKPYVMLERLK